MLIHNLRSDFRGTWVPCAGLGVKRPDAEGLHKFEEGKSDTGIVSLLNRIGTPVG
jgi:hypothetical protein